METLILRSPLHISSRMDLEVPCRGDTFFLDLLSSFLLTFGFIYDSLRNICKPKPKTEDHAPVPKPTLVLRDLRLWLARKNKNEDLCLLALFGARDLPICDADFVRTVLVNTETLFIISPVIKAVYVNSYVAAGPIRVYFVFRLRC